MLGTHWEHIGNLGNMLGTSWIDSENFHENMEDNKNPNTLTLPQKKTRGVSHIVGKY